MRMKHSGSNLIIGLSLHSGTVTLIKRRKRAYFGQLYEDTSQVTTCKQKPRKLAYCSWASVSSKVGSNFLLLTTCLWYFCYTTPSSLGQYPKLFSNSSYSIMKPYCFYFLTSSHPHFVGWLVNWFLDLIGVLFLFLFFFCCCCPF